MALLLWHIMTEVILVRQMLQHQMQDGDSGRSWVDLVEKGSATL